MVKKIVFSQHYHQILILFKGDISSQLSCKDFLQDATSEDILIHTAGLIHPKSTKDFFRINVQGTMNIVHEAIEKKIKKIIVISLQFTLRQ